MRNYLFEGEKILHANAAKFVLHLDEQGLPRLRFDQATGAAGMAGKESIGGTIFLTKYRLFFQSHGASRFNGTFSIFLPAIVDVKDTSRFLTKKMDVETSDYTFEFTGWEIPKLTAALTESRAALTPDLSDALLAAAQATPTKCGDGLKVFPPLMNLLSK